jgi:cysteine-rich repeat protein
MSRYWSFVVRTVLFTGWTLAAGCSFDPSALDERLCTESTDCSPGLVCQAGICIGGGANEDIDPGDIGPDVGDGSLTDAGCDPATFIPFCDGLQGVTCNAGQQTASNCGDPSTCGGTAGCYCAAGACLPRVCAPGSTRCAGEVVETCSENGSGYEAAAPCDASEVCLAGTCLPRDCAAGTTQCVGERIVECGDDGLIVGAQDCTAEDAWCDDSTGLPVCRPRVCVPGEVTCDGRDIVQCDDRGTQEVVIEECGDSQACVNGACEEVVCVPDGTRCSDILTVASCNSDGTVETSERCDAGFYCGTTPSGASCVPQVCEPETIRCNPDDEAVEQCEIDGSRYLNPVPCGAREFCQDADCVPWTCTPGSAVCDGEFSVSTCDGRGASASTTRCGSGQYCNGSGALATCAPQVCEPGTLRCVDLTAREVCSSSGATYVTNPACTSVQSCVDGECVPRVCEPSVNECIDGFSRSVCNATGTGETLQACPGRTYCGAGDCQAQVCTPNSNTCANGTTRRTCNALGSTSTDTPCGTNSYCDAGVCRTQVCTPGAGTCVDNFNVRECNTLGSGQVTRPCETGTYCSAGACVPQVCAPGARACSSPSAFTVCNAAGSAVTTTSCGGTEYCSDGSCLPRVCTPAASTCSDGDTRLVCNEIGSTTSLVDCPANNYCLGGACSPRVCTPSTTTCTGDFTRSTCNELGSATTTSPCAAGTYCSAGSCLAQVCTPNSSVCESGTNSVTVCNAAGSAETTTPCADGELCTAGVCGSRICTPDAVRCSGNVVETCNGTGTAWTSTETCATTCSGGACVAPGCGDGIVQASLGETCDDGNALACDGCESCRIANVASITATTVRTGGGTWAPNASDFTIELWARATASGGLVGLGGSATDDYGLLALDAEGNPYFEFFLGTGSTARAELTTRDLRDNQWHHVAGVRTGQQAFLFIDGVAVAHGTAGAGNTQLSAPGNIFIGSRGVAPASAVAQIDEVRISSAVIYRGAFTPERSLASSASTIALYRFDTANATAATDSGTGGRNVTFSNATRAANDCLGNPGSYVCGDGARAPWERCEPGSANCTADCERQCTDRVGPTGTCLVFRNNNDDWVAHRDACTGIGGALVTIDNAIENVWLRYLSTIPNDFWIGLNDRTTENTFVWQSGSTAAYRNWSAGEPNDFGVGAEDCAAYVIGDGLWNDIDCGSNVRALCEIP